MLFVQTSWSRVKLVGRCGRTISNWKWNKPFQSISSASSRIRRGPAKTYWAFHWFYSIFWCPVSSDCCRRTTIRIRAVCSRRGAGGFFALWSVTCSSASIRLPLCKSCNIEHVKEMLTALVCVERLKSYSMRFCICFRWAFTCARYILQSINWIKWIVA